MSADCLNIGLNLYFICCECEDCADGGTARSFFVSFANKTVHKYSGLQRKHQHRTPERN